MRYRTVLLLLAAMMLVSIGHSAEELKLESPDGLLGVAISNDNGLLQYRVTVKGQAVVAPSRLGMMLKGDENNPFQEIKQKHTLSVDEPWTPVCGKRSRVCNTFNELSLTVASKGRSSRLWKVVFRAYDEGIAFRYVLGLEENAPKQLTVIKDMSEIDLSPLGLNAEAWSYAPERRPIGPERISEINGRRKYPLVVKNSESSWLAITEAALHDFDNFDLGFTKDKAVAQIHIDRCSIASPFATPWRVIMMSDEPKTFLDSDLLVNLSPPPEGDFSWVKPGLSLWDWRAWGHQTKDGFTYGLEIKSWKRFINFAAEHDIPYLLLDANWYGPEHSTLSDPFKGGKASQVKEALEYGKEKGVGLILYLNDRASVKFSIEEIAKAYSDWGAAGIKYGFMQGGNQGKVRKTERIVRACAKNKLLVNFHDGPIPPTGHERTWPNWNTREYVHAQSDAMRTHSPGDFIHLAYVNSIAGPIDGNHGMFDHKNSVSERPKMFKELYSTIVAEAARSLILYSGLTVIPDSPDSYKEHLELFEFIAAQKQPWKQSVTLAGEFGKWITTMRQANDNTYLVASATDESSRTVKLPLSFLKEKRTYLATIFHDAKDAHYKTNRTAYRVEHREVTSSDTLEAHLAPGGGHCLIIKAKQ